MTKAVNIYLLSRIRDEESFRIVEDHLTRKLEKSHVQYHEMESLRRLVNRLAEAGLSPADMDGFFYGYHVPRIGKEFDLLKLTAGSCLNIELKSQEVPESQIRRQLLKNRYYLSHLGRRLHLFTVVTNTMACYRLSVNEELLKVDFKEICEAVKSVSRRYITSIDELFRASEYLVSPTDTPEKFIQGEYFLTQAQEQVKKDLLAGVETASGSAFFHVYGRAGTGKTLMIYDAARTLAKNGRTLIIHCGRISEGQKRISREITNLTVIPLSLFETSSADYADHSFIFADEAQRMTPEQFHMLCGFAEENGQICVLSSDDEQILTASEMKNDIAGHIRRMNLQGKYGLSEKIRMNKELYSFILCLKNLSHREEQRIRYDNVEINYADTTQEAQNMLAYYRNKGYVFINYAHVREDINPFAEYEEDFDVESVIGREFDQVVILMDASFSYDEDGRLQGIPFPDPDYLYPNLFYQGVTRVREKLALIIVNAPELFAAAASILKYD